MEFTLSEFIRSIYQIYQETNAKWKNSYLYSRFNLKENTMEKLNNDSLSSILSYRAFLNINSSEIYTSLLQLNVKYEDKFTFRVKNINSIEFKIHNYINNITGNHESGKVPIIKCFDDLFGLRLTLSDDTNFEIIKNIVDTELCDLKLRCIDVVRGDYKAIHIYFKNGKYEYPWELQIWNKSQQDINLDSHYKYKQSYRDWEEKYKRR